MVEMVNNHYGAKAEQHDTWETSLWRSYATQKATLKGMGQIGEAIHDYAMTEICERAGHGTKEWVTTLRHSSHYYLWIYASVSYKNGLALNSRARAGKKTDDKLQDLCKAKFYLDREIEKLQRDRHEMKDKRVFSDGRGGLYES